MTQGPEATLPGLFFLAHLPQTGLNAKGPQMELTRKPLPPKAQPDRPAMRPATVALDGGLAPNPITGAIQPDIKVGQFVFARTSVGFDGLLNYYKGRNEVCDLEIEKAFMKHTGWSD